MYNTSKWLIWVFIILLIFSGIAYAILEALEVIINFCKIFTKGNENAETEG